jgi:hypothetical protein
MNGLLRPRICQFFRASLGVAPCDVPFRHVPDPIPRYRGTVARWHSHLHGLATAIHETSGLDRSILLKSVAALSPVCTGLARQGEIPHLEGREKSKESAKMKKVLLSLLFVTILPANSSPAAQQKARRLEATKAALVMQSLQLGDKAQQLFATKDDLLKIVKIKEGNISPEEDMMIAAATEMKYIATVAYFEGNLLGAVLALKKEFKLQFIDNRILELENVIKGTISSLQSIQAAHSRIADRSAVAQMDKSIKAVDEILEVYRNSIEVLQRIKKKEFALEGIKQP